jgi:L-gulono-1,4-lactone dehydrogenase
MRLALVWAAHGALCVAALSWSNWNGEQTFTPRAVVAARTEADVAAALQQARAAGVGLKVVGAGHSFSPIDVSPGAVVVTLSPPTDGSAIQQVDASTVRVHAGVHIWELNAQLEVWGLALANMGAIANQTIAGATSTSTHGTGATGSLASFIVGITGVLPNGTVFNASADGHSALFQTGRVGYGALFVATWFNVRVVPLWRMEQITAPVPLTALLQQLPALRQQFDRLQWYWFPYTDGNATLLLRVNTT